MKSQQIRRWFYAIAPALLLSSLLAALSSQAVALGAPSVTFIVNSNNDANDGTCDVTHCSLREAINAANASAAVVDTITFNIGGGGTQTIAPTSALPAITDPATIDGTTQPGYAGAPLIELDGTNAGAGVNGLNISAENSTVKSLVINRFGGSGIVLTTGGGNVIVGSFIGTNVAGDADLGNGMDGIQIASGSGLNIIGGSRPAGPCVSPCNLISGNDDVGILISGGSGNLIRGNLVGTDVNGTSPLGNTFDGIGIVGSIHNMIGGPSKNVGNIIAFNGFHGVSVREDASTENQILSNSIYGNAQLGIDLGNDDVPTPNDDDDVDTGPNNNQNYPRIAWATSWDRRVRVTLDSAPNTTFLIQVFETQPCDRNRYGEGKKLIGSKNVTTNATGYVALTLKVKRFVKNRQITATATDPNYNTSEFSKCRRAS
ncbi:MAG: right-handed parallel beta-helix repeat-containing protein [Chloroflexi bacterium]|nr:right-handed parallel beta-helix repeat-containing protein [Chloroflexota bacterium]